MPRDREKNIWPAAVLRTFEEVFLERFNVPAEHELVAVHCAGLNSNVNDDDKKHDKQSGHADLTELLDAFCNACCNDEYVDAMKIAVQRIIWPPLMMNWPKNSEISATFQVSQPKIAVR